MDYVPGPTLSSYLREHAPLPPLEALNYAMQICDVLDYLHQQTPPVIFRDLKPSNIILSPDDVLILVDFGIARYFKTGHFNDTTDFGSPGYASPEQYLGEGQTDARSDLYSLGVVLHEMLSGKHPKGSNTTFESPRQVNPALSSAICGLVALATHADPLYRIQSARVFYMALERIYAIEERNAYQHLIDQLYMQEQLATPSASKLATTAQLSANVINRTTGIDTEVNAEQHKTMPNGDMDETNRPTLAAHELPFIPPRSWHFDQRHLVRQTLQRARQEQVEDEYKTRPVTAIMEDVKQQALVVSRPWPTQKSGKGSSQATERRLRASQLPSHSNPCALQASLALILVLSLGLTSLLIYQRYFVHQVPLAAHQSAQSTPPMTQLASYTWQSLPSLPGPEADNTAVFVQYQGRPSIYMIGGYRSQDNTYSYDRKLYRYDILAARWETIETTKIPGTLNNSLATDGHGMLFFTAGYSTDSYTVPSAVYSYQIATGSLHRINPPAQMPIGFGGSMFADQQGHLYISQGFMQAGHPEALAGTGWYRYDIASRQWQQRAPLPQGLGYTLLTSDGGGSIYLFGGSSDVGQQQQTDRIYRYDTTRDNWELMHAKLPHPLSGASGCTTSIGQLVTIGGYTSGHMNEAGQAWLLHLYSMQWQALPAPPFGHAEMGAAACDDKGHVFVERGADANHHPTLDFYELTLR